MQNANNSRDMQVTVRLAAIAVVGLLVIGSLGWLRYDLGREAFYTVLAGLFGIVLTLVILSIAGVGFRLAQRSDNKEIAMMGVFRGMLEVMAAERKAQTNDWRILNEQAALAAKNNTQALPMFDDDDDDEPFFFSAEPANNTADADGWVGMK